MYTTEIVGHGQAKDIITSTLEFAEFSVKTKDEKMGEKGSHKLRLLFVSRRKEGSQSESVPASHAGESQVPGQAIRRFFNFAHAEGSLLRNQVETRRTEG